jgi:hypothetical protein
MLLIKLISTENTLRRVRMNSGEKSGGFIRDLEKHGGALNENGG